MFGYSDSELLGQTTEMLYADPQDFVDQGRKRFRSGSNVNRGAYEVRYKRKDGSVFWTESLGAQVKDSQGNHLGFIGIFRDITERHKAEETIRRLNAELEQRVLERTSQLEAANKELETFSYSVSHDLRAPLRSIDGFAHALEEDYAKQLDDTALDYLNRVRQASQRMGTLIDDMLNLSRVARASLRRETVDVSRMAKEIVDELKQTESQRVIDVSIASDLKVSADPVLFRVALQNLLENAWKYTRRTSQARIEFATTTHRDTPCFYVRDNGTGFDMQYANKLFAPFQRLHSVQAFEGTGIGLATVARIIRRHGGRIWAEAAVDRGATFYFTLD
jgi:PAS domain S-box-containing protein